MKLYYDAVVGFAVNPEIVVSYDSSCHDSKIPANDFKYQLSGTSANVSLAFQKLGRNALLLAAVGHDENDLNTLVLRHLLSCHAIDAEFMPVRQSTSVALLPIDNGHPARVVGRKTPLMENLLSQGLERVESVTGNLANPCWKVATGIAQSELPLVKKLYENSQGKRVATPNMFLMADIQVARELLALTDMLVCSDLEFTRYFGKDPQELAPWMFDEIHGYGVGFIAVTCNSHGAVISLCGDRQKFPAIKVGRCISETGAGDWWLAGFLTHLMENGACSVQDITPQLAGKAAMFAAMVAGLKVTYSGGSCGPTRQEVEKCLCVAAVFA